LLAGFAFFEAKGWEIRGLRGWHGRCSTAFVNVGLYQAASALDANSRWQEVIADNLASGSVPGFKQRQLSLESVQAGLMPANNAKNLPQTFSIPQGVMTTNFTQGDMKYTGVNTDVAVDGKGFFEVQLPNGSTGLTRDGEFQVNSLGQLVTKEGYRVFGVGPGGTPQPIDLDSNNSEPLSISAAGEVNQGSEDRGQLLLTDVEKPQLLTQISGGYFLAQDAGAQLSPSNSTVRAEYLEGSNTSAVGEMANLMTAMRGFEANQHVIQIQDDRMSKTITELGNPS
jgi:flagellar basal-body rod protein FlgG